MKTMFPELGGVFLFSFTLHSFAVTHYVDLNSPGPVTPYTSWATAATNIQDAVDVAANFEVVLVTNGVYSTGGHRWYDSGTNRVTLTNAATLRSVNGPTVTLIVGHQVSGAGSVLTNAARCVAMGNNAVLSGFTLTNGSGGWGNYPSGGGVANVVGVAAAGTVTNCILISNQSTNGSGGGADRVKLINCQIVGNYAPYGGGACGCSLVNCVVVSNKASLGGGVYGDMTFGLSVLTNCTVVRNSATSSAGGVYGSAMNNCIVYYNTAPTGSNYAGGSLNYCCTMPSSGGTSFTNVPQFLDIAVADLHLRSNSPCINAGSNGYVTISTDLDANPRIVRGIVDIGAYESQTAGFGRFNSWLQQYGLPADGSSDFFDTDNDGLDNWQEWVAGTTPTNQSSVLTLASPVTASTRIEDQLAKPQPEKLYC